jgi:exopolysaccharide production protein ExoY
LTFYFRLFDASSVCGNKGRDRIRFWSEHASAPAMLMSNPNQLLQPAINCAGQESHSKTETEMALAPIPGWKRTLDVTLILMAFPFLIPVGVIVFVFVKIVSPGPAFFRQQRIGHSRRRFMCLKFRTMKVNADTGVHQEHLKQLMTSNQVTRKLDCAGDKRLIFGGMWLRAAGVDELPQLVNVLCGDMSLVGPRPCTPFEFELFSERYKQRCGAPPGLTGLWQISGKNKTTFEEMVDLDLKYVREKSLWLDLKIMALTIPAILKLIWEMKILPKLGMRPVEKTAAPSAALPGKAAGTLSGTVSARE